jgi:ammonium transporter, Amt family
LNKFLTARMAANGSSPNSNSQKHRSLKRSKVNWNYCLPVAAMISVFWVYAAIAQNSPPAVTAPPDLNMDLRVGLDTMWTMITAFLVFFMNAGFALVESGFCRRKNAVNILAKNLIVFAIATVAFWSVGFSFMFGDGNDFIGLHGFFLGGEDNSPMSNKDYKGVYNSLSWTGIPIQAKFFFQLVFAGTAATIVSGAVAERIKFVSFLVFSFLLVAVSYAVTGHWIWGGGWLAKMGFYDFAGSTVVHSVGGWAALVGAAILGSRIGRYSDDGTGAMPGHNMGLATLGCLILWLGWFGFNPGSTMALNPKLITQIALTTNMAAATGGIAATIVAWIYLSKPDLSMIINGILGGLVAITAPCAFVSVTSAAIIGAVAGTIVIFAVVFFDKLQIDDPVGALSVHLVNGIWGTLALGLFSQGELFGASPAPKLGLLFGGGLEQLSYQAIGSISVGGFTVLFSFIVWYSISILVDGVRVPPEEEIRGLDIGEHGMEAYSDFSREYIDEP